MSCYSPGWTFTFVYYGDWLIQKTNILRKFINFLFFTCVKLLKLGSRIPWPNTMHLIEVWISKYHFHDVFLMKIIFSFGGCSSLERYDKTYASVDTDASAYTSVTSTHKTCYMEYFTRTVHTQPFLSLHARMLNGLWNEEQPWNSRISSTLNLDFLSIKLLSVKIIFWNSNLSACHYSCSWKFRTEFQPPHTGKI